jgi:protein transport protein SEC61 subunit gamma-like protein
MEGEENNNVNNEQPATTATPVEPTVETKPIETKIEEPKFEERKEAPTDRTIIRESGAGFKLPNFNINFKGIPGKIIHTLQEYRRVIIVTKKPDMEEISKITKVAGLGTILIGVIGFIIQVIFQLFMK